MATHRVRVNRMVLTRIQRASATATKVKGVLSEEESIILPEATAAPELSVLRGCGDRRLRARDKGGFECDMQRVVSSSVAAWPCGLFKVQREFRTGVSDGAASVDNPDGNQVAARCGGNFAAKAGLPIH